MNMFPVLIMDDDCRVVDCDITRCGHSVQSNILDELGYTDYLNAECHHCHDYNGEISSEFYNELCLMEKN